MMERKNVYLLSVIVGILGLSGIIGWTLYERQSSKPIPRIHLAPAAALLFDKVQLEDDFDIESDDFNDPSLTKKDIVSLIFQICHTEKTGTAKAIFKKHLGSCKSEDTLSVFADVVVEKTDQSNVEAFNVAVDLLRNSMQRAFVLKSAVTQQNEVAFDALLDTRRPLISNEPVFVNGSSKRKITIFDFLAGQKGQIRRKFLPPLLRNLRVRFEETQRFADAVAKDGPHYVDLILEQGLCTDEEYTRLFGALYHNATILSGQDYLNLVKAIRILIKEEAVYSRVVVDRKALDELGPEKSELVDAIYPLHVGDFSPILAAPFLLFGYPFLFFGQLMVSSVSMLATAIMVTGGLITGATIVSGLLIATLPLM